MSRKNFSSQDVFLWESWRVGIKQQGVLLYTNSSQCTQDSEIFITTQGILWDRWEALEWLRGGGVVLLPDEETCQETSVNASKI